MTPIIPEPPERTATPAEHADHASRLERARTGRQLPRTLHALIGQAARLVLCGECWAYPAAPREGTDGYHLARFARAYRRGFITAAELYRVQAAAGEVRGGAR